MLRPTAASRGNLPRPGLAGRDVFSFYQMPDNPSVVYAGTNTGVYRSNDRGATWAFTGAEQIKTVEKPPARNTRLTSSAL